MNDRRNQPRQRRQPRRLGMAAIVIGGVLFLCVLFAGAAALTALFQAPRSAGPVGAAVTAGPGAATDPKQASLVVAVSPEKSKLLQDLANKFNQKGLRTPDRQAMQVSVVEMASDEMVNQALAGPTFQALTPDSSLWIDQINKKYAEGQQVEAGQIPSRLASEPVRYAITPIVIAAWEDSARALGWPNNPVGWKTLQDRARQDANFKWSHSSTSYASGLLATLAEFYAGAGVQRNLTAQMAQDQKTLEFVQAVEKTVRFYGASELETIKRAQQDGSQALNAFVVPEQMVVAFNTGAFGKPPAKLVALYPTEGTLWADHPLALLENPGPTDNQRRTFQAFREYLAGSDVQTQILKAGYRPADLSIPLNGPDSPITAANGVDPAQPQTTLQLPAADVVASVQNVAQATKRRTNVFLVVDTSGSMQGTKLSNVKEALKTFVSQIPSDQERVGMVEFNSSVTNIIEIKTLKENRQVLTDSINRLTAGGNTALYDGVATAYNRLQAANDAERINAIVVMTDGIENASRINQGQLVRQIQDGNKKLPILIFTIAYGSDADQKVLKSFASASGGQSLEGTPETIRGLYKILSSYF